jgi:hypothetical protein
MNKIRAGRSRAKKYFKLKFFFRKLSKIKKHLLVFMKQCKEANISLLKEFSSNFKFNVFTFN